MQLTSFLILVPEFRDYVWGGDRLQPGHYPTAEAWVVWEQNRIDSGLLAGRTLSDVAREYGAELLGQRAMARTGTRFPLLIKLLDCAQWLSLQVHPNDEQAIRLEGPGQFGKTEAWHILEADANARLIVGLKPCTSQDQLVKAIRNGTIAKLVEYANVSEGDTVFMPAGTIHALGPGLLIYEVQETSDWTYRVYDWDRPSTKERPLHIDKSIQVTRADLRSPIIPKFEMGTDARHILTACEYFTLELLATDSKPVSLDTQGETFHAITVIEGKVCLHSIHDSVELERFQTALVPAGLGGYELQPIGLCRALKSSVELRSGADNAAN